MSIDRIDGVGGAQLSAEARQISKLHNKIRALPEVRGEKVEAIRKELEDGTYRVDPRQVAEAIVELEDGLD